MKNMLWNKHLRNINNSELKYFFFNHFQFNRCKEWERTSTCIPSNNFWASGTLPIWMLLTKNKMLIGILLFLFNNLLVIKKQAKLIDLNMAPIWFNWSLRRSLSSLFMRSFNSSFVIRWVSRLWWLLNALEKPFVYVSTRSCYGVGWDPSQTRIRFIDENKEEENKNHKNDDYQGYCKHQCYSCISPEQQVMVIESELVSWFCLQGGCRSITSLGKILFHWHSRFCIFFLLMKYSPLDGSCLYSLLQIRSCEQGQARNVSFPRIGIHSMNKTIFFVDLFKNWSGSWSPWNPPPSIQAHDCPTQRMDRHWQGWLFDSENACDENQRKQNSSI